MTEEVPPALDLLRLDAQRRELLEHAHDLGRHHLQAEVARRNAEERGEHEEAERLRAHRDTLSRQVRVVLMHVEELDDAGARKLCAEALGYVDAE